MISFHYMHGCLNTRAASKGYYSHIIIIETSAKFLGEMK